MSFGQTQNRERVGRPTQFHGVSLEERAFDSSGNRLPWALEFPDGHPNARLARKQPEEKGSFGRSARRTKTGSTRGATRTQTPATREINSSLRGFEQALQFDTDRAPKAGQQSATSQDPSSLAGADSPIQTPSASAGAAATAASTITQTVPPDDAEPTQMMLYGFAEDSQWSAIQFYENASGGIICEEYDRDPPDERKRWHGGGMISHGGSASSRRARRALTAKEAKMSMQYRGGAHWVRVTFDSAAAAGRATAASPHLLLGHWVYAAPWRGTAPEKDEALLLKDEDRAQPGRLSAPQPASRSLARSLSSVPNSPVLSTTPGRRSSSQPFQAQVPADSSPQSSSATASSGTATASEPATVNELRQRSTLSGSAIAEEAGDEGFDGEDGDPLAVSLHRFPQQGRLAVKPVGDALLPSKSFSEKLWKWLADLGLAPGEIIGSTVPRKDNGMGDFDWEAASYYWRLMKWFDDTLGTDMCGMKDV